MSAAVGIVGDFNPKNPTHVFTNAALGHLGLRFEWVPTETITDAPERVTNGRESSCFSRTLAAKPISNRGDVGLGKTFGRSASVIL